MGSMLVSYAHKICFSASFSGKEDFKLTFTAVEAFYEQLICFLIIIYSGAHSVMINHSQPSSQQSDQYCDNEQAKKRL